jgi:hypothetical protein
MSLKKKGKARKHKRKSNFSQMCAYHAWQIFLSTHNVPRLQPAPYRTRVRWLFRELRGRRSTMKEPDIGEFPRPWRRRQLMESTHMSCTQCNGGDLTSIPPFAQEGKDERLHEYRPKEQTTKITRTLCPTCFRRCARTGRSRFLLRASQHTATLFHFF